MQAHMHIDTCMYLPSHALYDYILIYVLNSTYINYTPMLIFQLLNERKWSSLLYVSSCICRVN